MPSCCCLFSSFWKPRPGFAGWAPAFLSRSLLTFAPPCAPPPHFVFLKLWGSYEAALSQKPPFSGLDLHTLVFSTLVSQVNNNSIIFIEYVLYEMQPARIFIHSFNKCAVRAYYVPGSLSHSFQRCLCPALISLLIRHFKYSCSHGQRERSVHRKKDADTGWADFCSH